MKICKMIVRVIIVILFLFSALILYSLVEPNFSDYLASLLFQPKYQEEVPVKLVEVGAIEDEVEDQEQWSIEKRS